jgi:ABC-type methionine transport system ATPase subunit
MMRMKTKENLTQLEQYFQQFRKNIIGINQDFNFLRQKQIVYTVGQPVVVYTVPIEEKLMNLVLLLPIRIQKLRCPVAMTKAYHHSEYY